MKRTILQENAPFKIFKTRKIARLINTTVQTNQIASNARLQIAMYVRLIQKDVSHAIKGSIFRIIYSNACRRALVVAPKLKYMSRMGAILGK